MRRVVAVDGFDAVDEIPIGISSGPAATDAACAGGIAGMIDGDYRAGGLRGAEDGIDGGSAFGFGAKVDEIGGSEDVRVSGIGCDLAAGDQQDLIEIRLQFALGVVVRDGVVVGDGDEVQLLLHRVLDGDEDEDKAPSFRTGWCRCHRCAPYACAGRRDTSARRLRWARH